MATNRVQANISLTADLNKKVEDFSIELGITKSAAVAMCISEYFRSRELLEKFVDSNKKN